MGTITTVYRVTDNRLQRVCEEGLPLPTNVENGTRGPLELLIDHVQRHRSAYATTLVVLGGIMTPLVADASTGTATGVTGGINLIKLLQKGAFFAGMGVTIWGIVESMLDFPGWRSRIIKGVLGYVGILLVPLVFLEIQDGLQIEVWDRIEKGLR